MADQQSDYALLTPGPRPVVDRLIAHAELLGHLCRLDFTRRHQQACRTRGKIPMSVIDRQLLNVSSSSSLSMTTHFIQKSAVAFRQSWKNSNVFTRSTYVDFAIHGTLPDGEALHFRFEAVLSSFD
jgi:hypothetical protein